MVTCLRIAAVFETTTPLIGENILKDSLLSNRWNFTTHLFAKMAPIFSWFVFVATAVTASTIDLRALSSDPLASCPGYKASNVKTTSSSLTADLSLAGKACNVYGTDLTDLTLSVVYETGE